MINVFAILVRNELLGFLRSRSSLFWTLAFPVFLLSVMLFAFGGAGSSLGEVKVAFTPLPSGTGESTYSAACRAEITDSLTRSDAIKVRFVSGSNSGANAVIVRLGAHLGEPSIVRYDFNGPIVEKAAARLIEMALARCAARQQGIVSADLVRFENTVPFQRPFNYGMFFVTGILVMSFMTIGLNSTATAIAALRERNTFKLYVCFPVSRFVFLAALITARMIMMALSAIVLFLVARLAFGIALPLWSSAGLRALPIVALGAAMVLSFGVLLASRAKSLAAAELACNITYYPLLFLSDLTIPMHGAPEWLKDGLKFIPVNQFAVTLRGVLLDGGHYASFLPQLFGMAVSTLIFMLLAARMFRWHDA
ncbi:ABC transporter permease [Robbsia andropogonis]|uniref:ABC transporter permease n=1 Tax=Robbsia andropogonis TaxID=28092 RepID=A0A0F5K5Z2_9BURK|nr:ABC transporter permease [Robbsia andropogonis]KKB64962.1 ABC transporter permease [Robbsia andropogonis]MCP1118498.1 ABC transporter permease [Robbsia andropogonis]MCP1127965.1 ABC transporter permease [Robbsia andropogonis]